MEPSTRGVGEENLLHIAVSCMAKRMTLQLDTRCRLTQLVVSKLHLMEAPSAYRRATTMDKYDSAGPQTIKLTQLEKFPLTYGPLGAPYVHELVLVASGRKGLVRVPSVNRV